MSYKIGDKDYANDIWLKPKNSKSTARSFAADDVSHIGLSNKFSILEDDHQNQGLLKHEDMKIKSPTGESKSHKKRYCCLEVVTGGILDPCFKNTWVLNIKYLVSWLHRASNNVETFSLPTDAHNVKKHRVIKTF